MVPIHSQLQRLPHRHPYPPPWARSEQRLFFYASLNCEPSRPHLSQILNQNLRKKYPKKMKRQTKIPMKAGFWHACDQFGGWSLGHLGRLRCPGHGDLPNLTSPSTPWFVFIKTFCNCRRYQFQPIETNIFIRT